ncbi:MAG TPA: hypothetical protein VMF58_04400 [Rhizomicrobium sp.]|nr:hypothetical protein [Rhizomicrobium sp.]
MIASRISFAILALALTAFGASAQSDEGHATAPPRQLGASQQGTDQPPVTSTDGLSDDTANPPSPKSQKSHASDDSPLDVSTDDLADDNEPDQPQPAKSGRHADAPPPDTTDNGLRSDDEAPVGRVRRDSVETAPLNAPVEKGPIVPKAEAVQTSTLGALDESSGGTLDTSNGGFESNIWNGSGRADIDDLLTRAPLASPDTAVHALARRVILTRADAPQGPIHRAFAAMRIQKLSDAALIDSAGELAAQVQGHDDADLARVQANALLLAGRVKDVCGPQTSARMTEGDLFWLELRAYCAAAGGDTATADMTREIMNAQGDSDPAYTALMADVLNGAKKPVEKISKPTALHVFLLHKAGLPVPADLAKSLGPSVNLLILRDPKATPDQRLAAAERVLRMGAVSTNELKAVADAQVFTAEQTAGALAMAPKLSFLKAQALLRRAAQLETRPAAKAAFIHLALTLGDKAGLFETASNLQADVAVTVDAKAVAQTEGPLIGWALLLAGKTSAAAPWLGDNDIARAVLGLASDKDDSAQAALSGIATRMATEADKAQNASRPMEVLLLGLYDAMGRTLPADAKAEASALRAQHLSGRRPDEAAMQKMLLAAATPERKGEAILRILDIVGAKGPGDLAPDVTVEIVRALEAMNLKDSAKSMAIHALMLYRPGTA